MLENDMSRLYSHVKKEYHDPLGSGLDFFSTVIPSNREKIVADLIKNDKKLKLLAYKVFTNEEFIADGNCKMRDGFFCCCFNIFNIKIGYNEDCSKKMKQQIAEKIKKEMKEGMQPEFTF